MEYWISSYLNWLVLIPALLGLLRFRKINPKYYFFLILVWMGLINEVISNIYIHYFRTNVYNSNIYSLCEAVIILMLYYRWRFFENTMALYYFLLGSISLLWLADALFIERINNFMDYFVLGYSFIVAMISTAFLNKLLASEKRNLLKSPEFIICICFIVFFTFGCITQAIFLFSDHLSSKFNNSVLSIHTIINLLINISFIYATLCMSRKVRFTMHY